MPILRGPSFNCKAFMNDESRDQFLSDDITAYLL